VNAQDGLDRQYV